MRYRFVPIIFLPILWIASEVGFALSWWAYLLRERQRAERSQRIREFIALADQCLAESCRPRVHSL